MRTETTRASANGPWLGSVDVAKDAYIKIVDKAQLSLAKANRRASALVRKYPVQATATAMALGYLVGAIIRRRA